MWASGRLGDGVVSYPLRGGFHVAWLASDDLGLFVAAALRRPHLSGRCIDIGGPEELDGPGLGGAFSAALGRPVRFVSVPVDAFEQGLVPVFGLDVARGIAGTYRWLDTQSDPLLLARKAERFRLRAA